MNANELREEFRKRDVELGPDAVVYKDTGYIVMTLPVYKTLSWIIVFKDDKCYVSRYGWKTNFDDIWSNYNFGSESRAAKQLVDSDARLHWYSIDQVVRFYHEAKPLYEFQIQIAQILRNLTWNVRIEFVVPNGDSMTGTIQYYFDEGSKSVLKTLLTDTKRDRFIVIENHNGSYPFEPKGNIVPSILRAENKEELAKEIEKVQFDKQAEKALWLKRGVHVAKAFGF